MSSLRRGNRPGLWVSPCGRFTVRKLGNGSWLVSPMHSPLGGGPFSGWAGERLLPQRFATRQEAAQALQVLIEASSQENMPVELAWSRSGAGDWYAQYGDTVVQAQRVNNLWRVIALPATVYQAVKDAQINSTDQREKTGFNNERFALEMMVKRSTAYLGSARTLSGAKNLVSQELAWKVE